MKLTREPWHKDGNTIYSLAHAGWRKGIEQLKNRLYAYVQKDRDVSDDEADAAANLMLDAFNTYHATGLTPSELAAQRDELRIAAIEALDAMKNIWRTEGRDDDWIYDEMGSELSAGYFSLRAAITNATKGEK